MVDYSWTRESSRVEQPTPRIWGQEDWRDRRAQLADIWEDTNQRRRRRLLAMFVLHAPEVVNND